MNRCSLLGGSGGVELAFETLMRYTAGYEQTYHQDANNRPDQHARGPRRSCWNCPCSWMRDRPHASVGIWKRVVPCRMPCSPIIWGVKRHGGSGATTRSVVPRRIHSVRYYRHVGNVIEVGMRHKTVEMSRGHPVRDTCSNCICLSVYKHF